MSDSDAMNLSRVEAQAVEIALKIANLAAYVETLPHDGVAVFASRLMGARLLIESGLAAVCGPCLEAAKSLGKVKEF